MVTQQLPIFIYFCDAAYDFTRIVSYSANDDKKEKTQTGVDFFHTLNSFCNARVRSFKFL